jgi:hypothetical protein
MSQAVWRVLGRVSLVIGVFTAAVSLYFATRPLWHKTVPPVASAEITELTLDQMSFASYLRRAEQPAQEYSKKQLAERGAYVEFQVKAVGFPGAHLPMRWEMFDVRNELVDSNKSYLFTPDANREEDTGVWSFFIPLASRRNTRHYVEVSVYQPDGKVRLARKRTQPFTAHA